MKHQQTCRTILHNCITCSIKESTSPDPKSQTRDAAAPNNFKSHKTGTLHKGEMHPPLTLHKHPMCAEIIELFQKCHSDHPLGKFFGECTELKIKLDRCFRQEKALKRKANFEESKKLKERLQAYRKETAESS